MGFPNSVRIVEVGPRDGLQNEAAPVPLEAKVRFVNALSASGLRDIEVTSFVSPGAVPQLADAADVLGAIEVRPDTTYWCLVPNAQGLERWLETSGRLPAGSRGIALFTAASETFNQRNVRASIDESLRRFQEIMTVLQSMPAPERPRVRGYISTAFVCPYEGAVEPAAVQSIAVRLVDLGVQELSLGDTIGAATPIQIRALLRMLLTEGDVGDLALHLHDTRGTALANVLESLDLGVTAFDTSAGGLGGCPFAPGASGNLATEDLLYMLNGMGIETGVDLGAVVDASGVIEPFINHQLPSKELAAYRSAGF